MEQKYAEIRARQLAWAERLYGEGTRYQYYLDHYTTWHKADPASVQKHYTLDSVFFISNEGAAGFRVLKFYNDTQDYRVSEGANTWAEAFSIGETGI